MAKLAFYTFGILHESRDHPQTKGFVDRTPFVYESAENSKGFVDRATSRTLEGNDPRWGESSVRPRYFSQDQHSPQEPPATISLWEDLEAVYAFAYYGRHAEALSKRKEWFIKPEWPTYVAWWVEDGQTPTREDASKRLEHLHDKGSTSHAFDFKTPFDAAGQPIRMDPVKIQERSQTVKAFDEGNPTGLQVEVLEEGFPIELSQMLAAEVPGVKLGRPSSHIREGPPIESPIPQHVYLARCIGVQMNTPSSKKIRPLRSDTRQWTSGRVKFTVLGIQEKPVDNTLMVQYNKLSPEAKDRKEYASMLPKIQAHGSELNQVWTSILNNATYVLDGEGEITIRTSREGDWVVVDIQDNGPGIPP